MGTSLICVCRPLRLAAEVGGRSRRVLFRVRPAPRSEDGSDSLNINFLLQKTKNEKPPPLYHQVGVLYIRGFHPPSGMGISWIQPGAGWISGTREFQMSLSTGPFPLPEESAVFDTKKPILSGSRLRLRRHFGYLFLPCKEMREINLAKRQLNIFPYRLSKIPIHENAEQIR